MESDDQWKKRPTRMRVEYVDGGESSIGSSLNSSSSSDTNSSGDDGSPNSLPEVYSPQIPPFGLIDQTKTMLPPSISSISSSTTSSGELFQIIPPDVIETTETKEETSPEVPPITTTTTTTTEEEEVVIGNNVGVVLGALRSPPVQVMDRSSEADHDPYRIPTAVFETSTSVAAVDWSNASNDSLFSIRIDPNASFAKDYRGKGWSRRESARPKRELTLTPDRWSKSPSPNSQSSPREEVVVVDDKALKISPAERKKTDQGDSSTGVKEEIEGYPVEEPKATHAESLNRDKKDEIGAYPKHYSCAEKKNNSGRKSSRSWCLRIFPCLAWPSWCFNTCCRPLCCSCKWPSCKCRFPSCSCCTCSLAICFCEHPCYSSMCRGCSSIGLAMCYICSCKPLTVLCCVTEPNSKDQVTDKQDYKGGCCSCFSGGTSCCSCTSCFSPCRSCFSCRFCCSFKSCGSCFPCGSCCKSCSSCFSCGSCCKSCFSCGSRCSCKSCSPCFSCGSFWKSCGSCFSCGSRCKSCGSCFSFGSCFKSCSSCFSCGSCCKSCRSCFSCGSCSCSCFTCNCTFSCCSHSWWRCRPHIC